MQQPSAGREPSPSTDQMLQLILSRLDRFPVERFIRMEADFQHLKALLEAEAQNQKDLAGELDGLAREIQTTIDQRMDRALTDCRQDRDLRLTHLADRIECIQGRGKEERALGLRMKIAIFSAIGAFVISIVNGMISLFVRQ